MTTSTNYKGRVWTCDNHNQKIEAMIAEGKTKEAQSLVNLLNPKKSRGICAECKRLYTETPPMNR
jgi:hypothetical protein